MSCEFQRIAIINRGEPAMRLIHAVREANGERRTPYRVIALHTAEERSAMFVREADEAVRLGTPTSGGSPYLDLAVLEAALIEARADAAWVGWGFVAERPEFADLCDRLGIVFIGPSGAVMRCLGDKIAAKLLAESAEVPVAPWSGGPVPDVASATTHAERIGFPLVIKATAGGGGRGIRLVRSFEELADAFASATAEASLAFGDPTVFLERVVTDARHIEVQIAADHHGAVWPVGVRDCSIQRRNQKVLEESASTALSAAEAEALGHSAARLAQAAGYTNLGTVEFLFQPKDRTFAFLEVNTRLQVEHPVTEVTTGLDLVKLQLRIAAGEHLDVERPEARGHAIEARLNAEDPERGFSPAPGVIEVLTWPTGPGLRVDTGVSEGDVISPDYDSMIAKIIAWGRDRNEALARLRRALRETTVVVRGGTTNKSFLSALLEHADVVNGAVSTMWLDALVSRGPVGSRRHAGVALASAAIDVVETAIGEQRDRFLEAAAQGRPPARVQPVESVELRHDGHNYRCNVGVIGADSYRVVSDGVGIDVFVERLGKHTCRLTIADQTYRVVSFSHGPDHLIEVDGVAHRFSRDDGGLVRAPSAAVVVSVAVKPGDIVTPGVRLATLEAMKMEVAIEAPSAGRIDEVFVAPNTAVEAGTPLVRLDAAAVTEATTADASVDETASARVALPAPQLTTSSATGLLGELRSAVLGWDYDDASTSDLLHAYRTLDIGELASPVVVETEASILDAFAALTALTRDRVDDDEDAWVMTGSSREHFNTYLRSLDIDAEGLTTGFRAKLAVALEHYGVTDFDRSEALENALFRIFVAQQRSNAGAEIVAALVERRLHDPTRLEADDAEALRPVLDQLIAAGQLRHPVVGNLARSLRHRLFEAPIATRLRSRVAAEMRTYLERLAAVPDDADALEKLVNSPRPIIRLVAERMIDGDTSEERMIEILTRRFYKIRDLSEPVKSIVAGSQMVRAHYVHRDRLVHLVAMRADQDDLDTVLATVADLAREVERQPESRERKMVVDLYGLWAEHIEGDAVAAAMQGALGRADLPALVQRVAVGACPRSVVPPPHFLTFIRDRVGAARPGSFVEQRALRGLHPMVARRLQLWRLRNFETTRLPSSEDVYVFHAAGRRSPGDERLIAVGELRDLTITRNAAGDVTSVPELDQVLGACLDGLRRALAAMKVGHRPDWNRVLLYVWPDVETPLDELLHLARDIAPLTQGLGIERVSIQGRFRATAGAPLREVVLRLSHEPGKGVVAAVLDPPTEPLRPIDDYTRNVQLARRRNTIYPYELVPLVIRGGAFVEYDLDEAGNLAPVDRPPGSNSAGVVLGLSTTRTDAHTAMTRLTIMGDSTRALGAITEAECRRLLAAFDLAESLRIPVEWFALSAGAKIAMNSGSENLDWVGRVLRRIVHFTQDGGECNVIVAGINVGAQPYWNAEATMLMHTRGILVMTPESAMVLTGKQALDYSGGVSAEDNIGLGGYERIMGPNGQAQYWAPDIAAACDILFGHYELTYVAAGERFPRRHSTVDPYERDVQTSPHVGEGTEFGTIGELFDPLTNGDRKKPFDIRSLMKATADVDHEPLERWAAMRDAEAAVVFDTRIGGIAVTLIGVESRPLARYGQGAADGPAQWSAGTLFPLSSKKVARAINAASGNRPVVVLANLSGFDGSPESLRRLQLEYGAEIGRAIVNFDGPITLCVVSRYHGGAFVVFSATLNDDMTVLAVEGSFASVIGGAPAAAVVFTGDVNGRTQSDPRVLAAEELVSVASDDTRAERRAMLAQITAAVRSEKLTEVAAEFDAIHSVERARQVGSVHEIVPAHDLRPALIRSLEQGMERVAARIDGVALNAGAG